MGSSLCSSNKSSVNSPTKRTSFHKSSYIIGDSRTFFRLRTEKYKHYSPPTFNYLASPAKKRDITISEAFYEKLFSFDKYDSFEISQILDQSANTKKVLLINNEKSEKIIVRRELFSSFDKFSQELLALQWVAQHEIEGVETFLEIKMMEQENEGQIIYILDLIKECKETLALREGTMEQKMEFIYQILWILSQLHDEHIYWERLRPNGNCFLKGEKDGLILAFGEPLLLTSGERDFYNFFVKKKKDHFHYDCILIAFLIVYSLSNVEWEILLSIRTDQNFIDIISNLNLNNGIKNLLITIVKLEDKASIPSMKSIKISMEALLQIGHQKEWDINDPLNIITPQIGSKVLEKDILFFSRKNKIYVYKDGKQWTIKAFLGKRKWIIPTSHIQYSKTSKGFITFAKANSLQLVRVPFDFQNETIFSSEIESYLNIKIDEVSVNPALLMNDDKIYLITNAVIPLLTIYTVDKDKKLSLFFKTQEDQVNLEKLQNFNAKDKRRTSELMEIMTDFCFISDNNLVLISHSTNIFSIGLTILLISMETGAKQVKKLNFMVKNEKMRSYFDKLQIKADKPLFCLEIDKDIFIYVVSKIILILDFKHDLFYSFCSLYQMQTYDKTTSNSFCFNIRGVKHDLEFLFRQSSIGIRRNFQKENSNETRKNILLEKLYFESLSIFNKNLHHSILEIAPEESCFILRNSIDLHTNQNLVQLNPKTVVLSWDMVRMDYLWGGLKEIEIKAKFDKYEVVEEIIKNLYKVRLVDEIYRLKKISVDNIQEFEKLYKHFFIPMKSSYLLRTKECFLIREEKKYFACVVSEPAFRTLEEEIINRKAKGAFFKPKELAFMIKCLFKGINYLNSKSVQDGNISLGHILLTEEGQIKIKGWYFDNKKNFESDFIDGGHVIFQSALLLEDVEFNFKTLEKYKDQLYPYNGLFDFLYWILKSKVLEEATFIKRIKDINLKLQYQNLQSEIKSSNRKKNIFWVNYGDNSLICSDETGEKIYTLNVFEENKEPYLFSSFNSFAYDHVSFMYITGKERNGEKQSFSCIKMKTYEEDCVLENLSPIPQSIHSSSLLYIEEKNEIYLIGGYLSSQMSNKVLVYSINQKSWTYKKDLPFRLLSSTAVFSNEKIYLFGGCSDDIDLTGSEFSFLEYDINKDTWSLKANFALRCPFINTKILQPTVITIAPDVFLFFSEDEFKTTLQILELKMGGLDLKFENKKNVAKKNRNFYRSIEAQKVMQDNIGSLFNKGAFMILRNEENGLFKWDLNDFLNTSVNISHYKLMSKNQMEYLKYMKLILEGS